MTCTIFHLKTVTCIVKVTLSIFSSFLQEHLHLRAFFKFILVMNLKLKGLRVLDQHLHQVESLLVSQRFHILHQLPSLPRGPKELQRLLFLHLFFGWCFNLSITCKKILGGYKMFMLFQKLKSSVAIFFKFMKLFLN